MSPAQRGARLLRLLGAEEALIRALVAEVWRWPPVGALEADDLWGIAVWTMWEVRQRQPTSTPGYVRTRVRWRLARAVDRERLAKGWSNPYHRTWERPRARMQPPVWDWGRPFLWSKTTAERRRAIAQQGAGKRWKRRAA